MMQRLVRFLGRTLLLLLVAVIAGYGALRGYLWYESGRVMDDIAAELSPYVRLDWESVDSSVPGTIEVHELALRPANGEGSAFIQRLEINSSELAGPRELLARLRRREPPARVELIASGIRIDSDDPLVARLDAAAGGASLGTPLAAAGCSAPDAPFTASVLQAVNQSTLRGEASLRIRRHEASGRTELLLDAEFAQVAAVTAEGVLSTADTPALTGLRVRYTDLGFNASRNHYCAARADEPVKRFIDRHLQAVQRDYREHGTPLSPEASRRYREFIRHGGDMLIDHSPRRALALTALTNGDGALASIARSAPSVSINGIPVDLSVAAWLPSDESAPARSDDQSTRTATNDSGTTPRYRPVPVEALAQHAGASVRLHTRDGQTHLGRLAGIDNGRIAVTRTIAGGEMRYTLPKTIVSGAEVRR
ncbi:hypothetical protein [Arhodomonas sp. AD133]|uniref:hypothetical protein n=1 Tax=Arhodomonas sp. AD133 TaxID=3415009 RepID=UPI003EC0CA10